MLTLSVFIIIICLLLLCILYIGDKILDRLSDIREQIELNLQCKGAVDISYIIIVIGTVLAITIPIDLLIWILL